MLDINSKTAIRRTILACAWRSLTALRQQQQSDPHSDAGYDRVAAARERRLRRETDSGIVNYEPNRWLGRILSDAECKRWSREVAAMECDGLILRLGDGRTTQLRLLPAGESAALALAEAQR
jgi:hypothetical protein